MARRWPKQGVCKECRTHHPNGWACPKELKAAKARIAQLERSVDILKARTGRAEAALEKFRIDVGAAILGAMAAGGEG